MFQGLGEVPRVIVVAHVDGFGRGGERWIGGSVARTGGWGVVAREGGLIFCDALRAPSPCGLCAVVS